MNQVQLFEQLFLPLQNQALGFAMSLTKSRAAAEDLFQDTALKAFDKIDQFDPASNPKAWFFTIMRNLFINEYRKKVKMPLTEFDDFKLGNSLNLASGQTDSNAIEKHGFEDVVTDEIRLALLGLDEAPLTIFLLYAIHRFAYQEIADITGNPIGTIKSSINRTKGKLKLSLQGVAEKQFGITEGI